MLSRPNKPDNLSTPGLNWRERSGSWVAVWIARADLVKRGYASRTARLWAGVEPTADDWTVIASSCERLQSQMLEWANEGSLDWNPYAIYDGKLKSLVRIYQDDPDSPFQELRPFTRKAYTTMLRILVAAVGDARIPELTFRDFKRWHQGFCKPKSASGPTRRARGHGLMTHIRIVIAFGALLKLPGCKDAKEILSGMEFPNPKKRTAFITATQCIAIRRKSHEMGWPSIAFAQAVMFETGVRQKDAIGERIPVSEPGLSDVIYGGKKWLHGMHSKEISPDLIWTHRLSKSLRGRNAILDPAAGKTEQFDLKAYPMVMEEWQHASLIGGPVIVCETTKQPWDSTYFGMIWRKVATAAGIPKNVQNRDNRASAITEGRKSGATLEDMRVVAGHSKIATTAGYDRIDLETRGKVATLRSKNRPQTT